MAHTASWTEYSVLEHEEMIGMDLSMRYSIYKP